MKPALLRVLTGGTGSGKTEWALRWAEANGAEILSCDSLLFYRGMDIGTAKPTAEERARVPHHLIDILDLTETMNVADYAQRAKTAAEAILARGRPVLAVGGSGFYLKTFFGAVADAVAVPAEVRTEVARRLEAEGLPAVVEELRRLNPGGLGALDIANPRRVTRALERCLVAGRPLIELSAEFARQPGPFAGWRIELARLEWPAEELDRRIEARVGAMLQRGLVAEVERLVAAGLEANPTAAKAIGYREVIAVLRGRLDAADLPAAIAQNTRALARKQRTWFRTQLPPHTPIAAGDLRDPAALFPVSSD